MGTLIPISMYVIHIKRQTNINIKTSSTAKAHASASPRLKYSRQSRWNNENDISDGDPEQPVKF